MAYTSVDFPTKKALKEAVAAGQKITIWSPGPFPVPNNGSVVIEGPQFPRPHRFYASSEIVDGYVTKVK